MTQRKHMKEMVEFAINPEALVFTKVFTHKGTEFYILVDYPLWREDREYKVRTDMTLEEAQKDRTETLNYIDEVKEAVALLDEL